MIANKMALKIFASGEQLRQPTFRDLRPNKEE